MSNRDPVILVHGILGFGPEELGAWRYWGPAVRVKHPQAVHEASVGPLGSAHDRACELFAQIRGCRVDYGEEHANNAGHDRYGTDYRGGAFYRDWSEDHPIHLVGHSLGGPTIRCLQHLLEQNYWKDHPDLVHPDNIRLEKGHPDRLEKKDFDTNHRWIRSISTISGVNNGSTLTYMFGANEQTGLMEKEKPEKLFFVDQEASSILPESAGGPIQRLLGFYTSVTLPFLDEFYDFDLGHWFKREPGEDLGEYLKRVETSGFIWGEDNACYTLTLQGAYRDNGTWQTYPDTYYFSYVTERSFASWLTGHHLPSPWMNRLMWPMSRYIGRMDFDQPPLGDVPFDGELWWENDGMVPTFSQLYPHTNGNHPVGGECVAETAAEEFHPGRWYFQWERGFDHTGICVLPQLFQGWRRREFYTQLYQRLAALAAVPTPEPVEEPVLAAVCV